MVSLTGNYEEISHNNVFEKYLPVASEYTVMVELVNLTHWGLVTPYGGRDQGQHWFR